jgi:hypothetical protein
MADDEQVVSDEQLEANKMHKARKAWAKVQHVASRFPNPLVESRTLRNPLVPQPEPDADPLGAAAGPPVAVAQRGEQHRARPVGESRTGGEDAPATHIAKPKAEAPQPGPQVVDVAQVQEDEAEAEHAKRVAAGKKAAATRARNEKKAKR